MRGNIRSFPMVLALIMAVVLLGWPLVTSMADSKPRSDFALLNMEPLAPPPGPDVSVQCGATRLNDDDEAKPTAFLMFITMGNRSDSGIGGVDGGVRVTYQDGDFVDYPIKAGETLQISLSGGGTPGVDQAIKVTSSPGPLAGAVLIGQVSLLTEKGKPNPLISTESFCTTTPFGGMPPF